MRNLLGEPPLRRRPSRLLSVALAREPVSCIVADPRRELVHGVERDQGGSFKGGHNGQLPVQPAGLREWELVFSRLIRMLRGAAEQSVTPGAKALDGARPGPLPDDVPAARDGLRARDQDLGRSMGRSRTGSLAVSEGGAKAQCDDCPRNVGLS